MCGIFCALSSHQSRWPTINHQRLLENRGPDSCHRAESVEQSPSINGFDRDASCRTHITFLSTVLSLRGTQTVAQPYMQHDQTSRLCWNGEAWTVDGTVTDANDTQIVYSQVLETTQTELSRLPQDDETLRRADAVAAAMSRIAGPYAFVFHDSLHGLIYFGRDSLGRRSLLFNVTDDGDVIISSIPDATLGTTWTEVEADGIYCVDLKRADQLDPSGPWVRHGTFAVTKAQYHFSGTGGHSANQSVGGDESPMSASAHGPVVPRLSLHRQLPQCITPLHEASPSVQQLEQLLSRSLSLRILNIPDPPCEAGGDHAPTTKLAVLFSGGLDCTVLARMTHDIVPLTEAIDLLNVAFENPRIHKGNSTGGDDVDNAYELCPDRITGRASHAELQRVCPGRQWRFIAINVPYRETLEHRQRVITLMHPHNTEMDLSISSALYFAARGIGVYSQDGTAIPYKTSARVLLSGLGADELLGGYQRHATAYNRKGFSGLLDELELDLSRLGKRNLGRDDRVISNWAREARFPYLDEQLLTWALAAPVAEKCGFGEPAGDGSDAVEEGSARLEPGKKVLRCLAWKLGMRDVAREKKRAIQFGARTAKMETGKTKGTHVLS